jgi:hypothetical protein
MLVGLTSSKKYLVGLNLNFNLLVFLSKQKKLISVREYNKKGVIL